MPNPPKQINQFICTETLDQTGESGEKTVWHALQTAFKTHSCLAYWRYPIFSQQGTFRKEPDILILDQQLGIIIIEIKSIKLQQITNISGHQWQYNNYFTTSGNPYQQAENQLFTLLQFIDQEPQLQQKITARALISLPLITAEDWQTRNFHKLPSNPPILFKNSLTSPQLIHQQIQTTPPLHQGTPLTETQWQLLLSLIAGNPLHCQPQNRILAAPQSRGQILKQLRRKISQFDIQQDRISKQIPPGSQRIRGIAGSGKTVILCQKAALMHLKHPDWRIALVFFSRSLYQPILQHLDRALQYFSQNKHHYDPKNRKLRVLHAWGSKEQQGFYRLLCQDSGIQPLSAQQTTAKQPNEALAEACCHLLETTAIPQRFDAILIDEGQDLIVNAPKFNDKQPFYWLAYQALRPVDPTHPDQKRLIWAYDEAQSLDCLQTPSASELLGEDFGDWVTGEYGGGIAKTEILAKCYRTPHLILTAAHALSMGWLRPGGLLTGLRQAAEWEALGYKISGELHPEKPVTVSRPLENSPHPLPQLWPDEYIGFNSYPTRQEEVSALAENIFYNLRQDGLRPARDILVIILGDIYAAAKLEKYVANFLRQQGIDIYIPTAIDCNILKPDPQQRYPNQFWWEGAVTISRIHRAKGQEAAMVYGVGLDQVATAERELSLRNQLLVAFTRATGWLQVSGVGEYPLYEELREVLYRGDTFPLRLPPHFPRELTVTDAGELLKRYGRGGRNFRYGNFADLQLAGVCLRNANFIGANFRNANLRYASLEGAKLIGADLTNADLTGANLRKAKLMNARLMGVNLQGVDLSLADVTNVELGVRNN
ncbi:pentapeptide repeat-containing protein [Spirulina sp. CS-785/01]|uniref:pentapeptide repeat-containing protein n=1 Tax=Spirulina sp. CS-785/01 TaxID=3021716 RepID=UPI00232AE040|nr:pentapeptide repeat-containing protein [Spirulina sp. CS-785/01]MDB9313555.1 pentapeptide repeat-containing protein [Spirulina sp. CS-785/01]